MNLTPKICAKPYIENDKSQATQSLTGLADQVLATLRASKAPFVTPNEIAPLLGVGAASVRYHARNCRALRHWRGQYQFLLDDPEHVAALRAFLNFAVYSIKTLPDALKPKVH